MPRLHAIALGLALLLPLPALAVSLGDEQVLSLLGDPVEVEIEVLQWEDIDLDRVQIVAAGPQEYAAFDLTWLPVIENLDFNLIGPNRAGQVKVLISSREPLDEPFLELLLVLRWPGGSLLREYVLLFDPPGVPASALTNTGPAAPSTTAAAPAPAPRASGAPTGSLAPEAAAMPSGASAPADMRAPEAAVVEETASPMASADAASAPPAAIEAPGAVAAPPPVAEESPAPRPVSPASTIADAPAPRSAAAGSSAAVLDPPAVQSPRDEARASPPPAASARAETPPSVRTQTAIEVDSVASARVADSIDDGRRTYQVRGGDTLWNIARQFLPAGAGGNVYQVLIALHELNRDSFINGNISLLEAGAVLRVPNGDDLDRIDADTAEAVFERRWNAATQAPEPAAQGAALPVFTGTEPPVAEPAASVVAPPLPPGTEAPAADSAGDALIVTAGPNVLQPIAAADARPTEPPAAATVAARLEALESVATPAPAATAPAPAVTETGAGTIAPVQDITASAESLEQALQSRGWKLAELELQVNAMRIRMQEAQTIAATLNDSLRKALENRAAREAAYTRNTVLLGTVALALLGGLVAAGVVVLRLSGQLRMQRGLLAEATAVPLAARSLPAFSDAPPPRAEPPAATRREPEMGADAIVEATPAQDSVADGSAGPEQRQDVVPAADPFARMDGMLEDEKGLFPGKS